MEQKEASTTGTSNNNLANLTQTTMATSNVGDVSMTMNPPDLGLEKPSPASTYPTKVNNLM